MKPKNTKRATKPAKRSTARSLKTPRTAKQKDRTRNALPDPEEPTWLPCVIVVDGNLLRIGVNLQGSVVVRCGDYFSCFTGAEFAALALAVENAYADLNIDGGADL